MDLGEVPTINKETLARKLTIDLHRKVKNGAGEAKYTDKQVEEMTDDMLTCVSLDFLGSGTKLYANKLNDKDPNIGKFCTMPVKMMFKDKKERILAEQHLRKVCSVKSSTPYPKGLRTLITGLISDTKKVKPGHFILAKVNSDTLTVSARLGRTTNGWISTSPSRSRSTFWTGMSIWKRTPTWRPNLLLRDPASLAHTNAAVAATAAVSGMPPIYNPRGDFPPRNLPLISIASQNCNSLNISTECRKQLTKMLAITALMTVLILSDIRLNSSEVHIERIKKLFLYEGKDPTNYTQTLT
jgi:hypothetical protein